MTTIQLSGGLAQASDPTAQIQTIDAIALERIEATATARAIMSRSTASPLELALTQTADVEATIAVRIEEILTATAQPVPAVKVQGRLSGNQNANLRECPDTECNVIGTIQRNKEVSIISVSGEWYEVELEGQLHGFVFSELVSVEDAVGLLSLPTPQPTSTLTSTPTSTPNLSMTATFEAYGALASPKGDGYYLVSSEILPGRWESQGSADDCYWERLDRFGDIIDNHFGYAGGTITLRETDFAVNIERCGPLEYVEDRQKVLSDDAFEPKGNGFYTVGVEIAPGLWRSNGQGDGCYWARLDRFQDINDNYFGNAGSAIYVNPADYEVELNDCGTFEYIGE